MILADAGHVVPDIWQWQPHPSVWLLVVSLGLIWLYVTRVVGPKAVPEGEPVVTRSQTRWFWSALVVMWVAADWPLHDFAEEYLYSAHMVQHLLLTLVVPPMFLLATPEWFARLVVGEGRAYRVVRFLSFPVVGFILYNSVFALGHWPAIVDLQVESGPFHFGAHCVYFFAALCMWMCVCGPFREMRLGDLAQVLYLFLMGIVPTIPGAWLVFAQSVVYPVYDHGFEVFGMNATDDQQLAGFIMKVVGGVYATIVAAVVFFKWYGREQKAEEARQRLDNEAFWAGVEAAVALGLGPESRPPAELTFDDVRAAFERSTAPTEAGPGDGHGHTSGAGGPAT